MRPAIWPPRARQLVLGDVAQVARHRGRGRPAAHPSASRRPARLFDWCMIRSRALHLARNRGCGSQLRLKPNLAGGPANIKGIPPQSADGSVQSILVLPGNHDVPDLDLSRNRSETLTTSLASAPPKDPGDDSVVGRDRVEQVGEALARLLATGGQMLAGDLVGGGFITAQDVARDCLAVDLVGAVIDAGCAGEAVH